MTTGRQKWEERRLQLHGKSDHWTDDLPGMSYEQLKVKQATAEAWLGNKDNEKHRDYNNLLRRYERICDLLRVMEVQQTLLTEKDV